MDHAFFLLFGISAPFYAVLIALEMALSHFRGIQTYSFKGLITNLWMNAGNFLLDLCMRGVFLMVIGYFLQFRIGVVHNVWAYWISLLLLEDLLFYFLHRVDHFCRIFWAVHVTHHSSEEFNLSVGFRSSVFQPLYRFIWFIPLAFLGFRPWDILFMYSITQIYGIIIHTRLVGKLGFLEWFLATPSHHRVHHGSNVAYLDKNLGMVLIIWDRLFGTFEEEQEEVRYGLTENIDSHSPVKILFHEWKNIAGDLRKPVSFKIRLNYLFGPPGWSHDGSKKTSRQLREEQRKRNTSL
ncbi:MAG TPA: sterol desaturase family protein [Bacteroidia bacterium]|jgi:sterol desaturase/sphingolipid hydroxylase (fatty acid hydroxylase superfamily)|nr:sterol desaturase family protein [Bacteroidia bacterium]